MSTLEDLSSVLSEMWANLKMLFHDIDEILLNEKSLYDFARRHHV